MFCTAARTASTRGGSAAALRVRVVPLISRKATNGGPMHQRRLLSDKAKQQATTDAAAKDTAASANKAKAEAPPAAAEEKKGGWWHSAEFWGGLGALAGWGSEWNSYFLRAIVIYRHFAYRMHLCQHDQFAVHSRQTFLLPL